MAVALIALPESAPELIAAALRSEGLSVTVCPPPPGLRGTALAQEIQQAVFICPERGVVSVGDPTTLVREWLGPQTSLILCASLMTADDRAILYDCGASSIVTPASWTAADIAERILAELILAKAVQPNACGSMHGATRPMRELYEHIRTLAPLSEPILILGKTGTGKELVARELHHLSQRPDKFIPINCPEISPELLPSELFGHERGAFTNATHTRQGLLVEAGRGTAFLDEIGELDLPSQAKLLRVLEDRQVRRVGANHWEEVKARIVMATNRDLEKEAKEKRFREDLRQRMQGFTVHLPPLHQRKADIPLLAHYFVAAFGQEYGRPLIIPDGALDCLFRYDWPGNVRELRGVIRKAAAYTDQAGKISSLILQEEIRQRFVAAPSEIDSAPSAVTLGSSEESNHTISFDPTKDDWQTVRKRLQKAYFQAVLREAQGSKDAAAKLAGLSRTQLYENLKKAENDRDVDPHQTEE